MTEPIDWAATQRSDSSSNEVLQLTWDKSVVPLEALERALYSLADRLTGTISSDDERWCMEVHPREPSEPRPDRDALCHQIRQDVNDQTLRVRIAQRTDPLRDLVFALAFSRTGIVNVDTES